MLNLTSRLTLFGAALLFTSCIQNTPKQLIVNADATKTPANTDPEGQKPPTLPKVGEETELGKPIGSNKELHRVLIENKENGIVKGSRDGGKSWTNIGTMLKPIRGGVWKASVTNGVLAFDFLRGKSQVFASAVNNLHVRFSDPEGYKLSANYEEAPVAGNGFSISPREALNAVTSAHGGVASHNGGTGIFGAEWSPRVGSEVLLGDGQNFAPIPYDRGPDQSSGRNHILIITPATDYIEYLEFENVVGGKVILKKEGEQAVQVAKVLMPVRGVGRFSGSEYLKRPGTIRANHAGVLDIGTTDVATNRQTQSLSVESQRGGFQIVPSHHFQDRSMLNGRDHPHVYMNVGPVQDPPHLKRYDVGIDGTYPLFLNGMRAGTGTTFFKVTGSQEWIEISEAVRTGRLKNSKGEKVQALNGIGLDALSNVTAIKIENDPK